MKSRSEQEMFDLILGVAQADPRVRAVVLNGSRANPSAPRDCFQDYDIGFIVTDVHSFTTDPGWIDRFGERMILQTPEDWHSHPRDYASDEPFAYLMQFVDGTRIDLNLYTLDRLEPEAEPTIVLLDKDGILPGVPEPDNGFYHVKPPTRAEYRDCCNEFWWMSTYAAKELWRDALPLAKTLLDENVRAELMKMLDWTVGCQHGFQVSTGKGSKYLRRYLTANEWSAFEATYPDLNEERMWAALLAMGDLFREKALVVASRFGYDYPALDDERVTAFLKHVRQLPRDAESIY